MRDPDQEWLEAAADEWADPFAISTGDETFVISVNRNKTSKEASNAT